MFQHGRLTAYHNGERQVIYGVIADVNCNTMRILNHEVEFQTFELKAIKGFRKEPFASQRQIPMLQCDCGCKTDTRYVCEKCGATFCGSMHGITTRDEKGELWDLCDKCAQEIIETTKA